MDPVMIEKLHAMKMYKRSNNTLFRSASRALIQYTLAVLLFGLFLSCPLWVPKACSSIRCFLFVALPSMQTALLGPGCLFLVCNVIVAVLVGQSMRLGPAAPVVADIYEEYAYATRRSKSAGSFSKKVEMEVVGKCSCVGEESVVVEDVEEEREGVLETGEEEEEEEEEDQEVEEEEEDQEVEEEEEEEEVEEEEEEVEEEEEEEEDSTGLPPEELNKRFEDFIAKVNNQRRLEAKMLVCSG